MKNVNAIFVVAVLFFVVIDQLHKFLMFHKQKFVFDSSRTRSLWCCDKIAMNAERLRPLAQWKARYKTGCFFFFFGKTTNRSISSTHPQHFYSYKTKTQTHLYSVNTVRYRLKCKIKRWKALEIRSEISSAAEICDFIVVYTYVVVVVVVCVGLIKSAFSVWRVVFGAIYAVLDCKSARCWCRQCRFTGARMFECIYITVI